MLTFQIFTFLMSFFSYSFYSIFTNPTQNPIHFLAKSYPNSSSLASRITRLAIFFFAMALHSRSKFSFISICLVDSPFRMHFSPLPSRLFCFYLCAESVKDLMIVVSRTWHCGKGTQRAPQTPLLLSSFLIAATSIIVRVGRG